MHFQSTLIHIGRAAKILVKFFELKVELFWLFVIFIREIVNVLSQGLCGILGY
jgi:hypothetical protein